MKLKYDKNPNASIYDPKKGDVLFKFVDGEFETDDNYIINFWLSYTGESSNSSDVDLSDSKKEETEVKKPRRGRPKKV